MASKKPGGLGRGLGALLGDEALKNDSSATFSVPIEQVESFSGQPRKYFDPVALQELADSIATHGIIQPITVRKLASGFYQIIAGERRWRASRLAGLAEIPVIVLEADDRKMAELAMVENLQREDLNPMEEARGFQTLIDLHHMTQADAARQVGKSRSAVTNALRLLSLCPEVAKLVEEGQLSAGHGRALLPLSEDVQRYAAKTILDTGLSVRQTELLSKRLQEQSDTPPLEEAPKDDAPTIGDYVRQAQEQLTSQLGRGVKIVSGRKKGRIELEYYGNDDLNVLLDLLAHAQRTP